MKGDNNAQRLPAGVSVSDASLPDCNDYLPICNMNDMMVLEMMMMIMSVSVLTCWKLNVFVFGFAFAHVQTLHTVNE